MLKGRYTTRDMCVTGIFTAIIAVMAQIVIPMPLGVPMTMQTFAVTLTGVMLGAKRGGMSALIYILLGAFGLPVFQSFTGGAGIIAGPTGGFILSFPLMAWLIGLGAERQGSKIPFVLGIFCGTSVNYICGMIMFSAVTGRGLSETFAACVLPFIPTAVVKAVAAAWLGALIKRRLPLTV